MRTSPEPACTIPIFMHADWARAQLSPAYPFTYGRPTAAGGRERPMSPIRATSVST